MPYKDKEKHKQYCKKYREEHRDKLKRQQKVWHRKNREKVRQYNKEWRKRNPDKVKEYSRRYYQKHREAQLKKQEEYRRELKREVFEVLGNKCSICGFLDVRALQVDHISGGGTEEYQKIGTLGVYRRVLEHPEDYQLLCANCNWIKRVESGEEG